MKWSSLSNKMRLFFVGMIKFVNFAIKVVVT